ncbi:DNA-binding protein [Budviciaceae bacterium CWB-B4]|uniref:DNA-binding protein n=1 Tax=Limnobaculum xujianqingii TaxID=2738837 RepID=A0A9D7AFA2_9GAMM|nr:DNA-binding protein [Limnobaculum xujianqingii]MBK5071607.1 DNA-binding protein [Limnobaculum xujianqingii]MBK5174916.1 DNA-binding protein [Limnobaculum xujianqingii]
MKTEEVLLARYQGSPLLSLTQLAEVLDRSPAGLRISLSGNGELAQMLRPGRIKIGRRLYYHVSVVAQVIDERLQSSALK